MLKVNQLPSDTNLTKVKFRLTDSLFELYTKYCGGEREMWFVGPLMGDWFVAKDPPEPKGSRQLFPMPELVSPADLLECEVVEILGLNKVEDIFNPDELEKVKVKS